MLQVTAVKQLTLHQKPQGDLRDPDINRCSNLKNFKPHTVTVSLKLVVLRLTP